jgi:phosphate transport system substrate-binding protein
MSAAAAFAQSLTGAGASFPAPIYQKWFGEYKAKNPGVQINYQSIGSGGGIRQLTENTVDFGASDVPMTNEQIAAVKIKPLHFPTVLGAVVVTYNLSGIAAKLRLDGPTISAIFMGQIKKWNDPKIRATNPSLALPDKPIVVVHRSDSSGTTFVWTDYLSRVSPEWKSKVGANSAVSWPTGLGSKGNEGVAGTVKQNPYSIGYVELVYAVENKMAYADVKNAAGKFITPGFDSVTAAAASVKDMPADFRISITNPPGATAYPISSFTWLLIPSRISDLAKKAAITEFLKWMLTEGQKDAERMSYAPLPKNVVAKVEMQIAEIK